MDFTALDMHITHLRVRKELLASEGLPPVRESVFDYSQAPESELSVARSDAHYLALHAEACMNEARALIVQCQSRLNETLAYLRTVDLPHPPTPPVDL